MRTLNRNATRLWYVDPSGEIEVVDEDGFFTGEIETGYTKPLSLKLPLYPATGKILEESFGTTASITYITNSTKKLRTGALLFRNKPHDNICDSYDFKITDVLENLNHYQYGLKENVHG